MLEFKGLCDNTYLNTKIATAFDLDMGRKCLDFFDGIAKQHREMKLTRYADEVSLDDPKTKNPHRWVALRENSLRAGYVDPENFNDALEFHKKIAELGPFTLGISGLDVTYIEALIGFDIYTSGSHDEIVFEALGKNTQLEEIVRNTGGEIMDFQPSVGITKDGYEIVTEIKTNSGKTVLENKPISVYCSVRKRGSIDGYDQVEPAIEEVCNVAYEFGANTVYPEIVKAVAEAARQYKIE